MNSGKGSLITNLATGKKYSVFDVINSCIKKCKKVIPYKIVHRRESDAPILYSESIISEKELKWKPQITSLDKIVNSMIEVYKRN